MRHKPVQAVEQEQVVIYQHDEQSYYAEVSKESLEEHDDLMEQIIEHAFETLNVQHLDLRVIDPKARRKRS
jgi:hypothetical protein